MDNKKKIIDDFQKKVKLIEKHNEHYFKNDSPKISDAEYDQIKTEAIKLENKFNFLKKLKLLKSNIGFTPSNKFKKSLISKAAYILVPFLLNTNRGVNPSQFDSACSMLFHIFNCS